MDNYCYRVVEKVRDGVKFVEAYWKPHYRKDPVAMGKWVRAYEAAHGCVLEFHDVGTFSASTTAVSYTIYRRHG